MHHRVLSTLGFLALACASVPAMAADLPRAVPPARAPAYVAPSYSWAGAYVGINGGGGWGRSDWDSFASGRFNTSGPLVGATVGYNWLAGPMVFGLEGDIDWTNIRGTFTNAACPGGYETRNSWLGTVRGRVGYAIDRVMPYVTGGLAVGDIRLNPAGFGGASDTNAGWTVGGGIEAALGHNWSVKAEYLHVDLGDISCSAASCGTATNASFRTNLFRGGVNFRF